MCKFNPGNDSRRMDPCMRGAIKILNELLLPHIETVACCCGHGIYPMTIVMRKKSGGEAFEMFSNYFIPRKRRFYRKDENGVYYIPETLEK